VDYDTYTAGAVQLAVELANLDVTKRTDVEAYLLAHDEWIEAEGPLTEADLAGFGHLAKQVRDVVEASSATEVVTRLNRMLAECSPEPRITDHDGTLHLHYAADSAPLITRLGSSVSVGLAHVICKYGRERLGLCAADDCADVFVDTSRNCSRRYCSETCASRTTVSAYRARQRRAAR
jgi:predicted RNA-binding Zn ribbon-like protein